MTAPTRKTVIVPATERAVRQIRDRIGELRGLSGQAGERETGQIEGLTEALALILGGLVDSSSGQA